MEEWYYFPEWYKKWYWDWTKISEMKKSHLENAICYSVKHPPGWDIELEEWRNKIVEMLDELCDRYDRNYDPMTDWDFHKEDNF